MATASPRSDTSDNHSGRLQLKVTVSSAKLKRKKNWFGTAIYTEVIVDGEIKKTAKSSSSSNPKWDEQLIVNVAPQTTLEFRVWSHHTLKADALLGKATVDLKQVLLTHNRKWSTDINAGDDCQMLLSSRKSERTTKTFLGKQEWNSTNWGTDSCP